jgi:hypothetical protein
MALPIPTRFPRTHKENHMSRTATGTLLVGLAVALPLSRADKDSETKKPPEGFTALFNGKDLTGWKDAEKQAEFWKAEDGVLHYVGKGGKDLATAKNYKNFEMWADWKLDKSGGDSGIFLRGRPQVQIWDIKEGSGGLLNNPKGSPGQKPSVVADNKLGEWNTFWIKMVGDKVSVKLNDKLVVDNCVFLEGKIPAEGPLMLEAHRGPVWFRNLFIKELD